MARVVQNLRLPNGNIKVMVEGAQRARLVEIEERDGTLSGRRSRSSRSATRSTRSVAGLHDQGAGDLRAVRQDVAAPGARGPACRRSSSTTRTASPTPWPPISRSRPPRSRACSTWCSPYERLQRLARPARGRDREDQPRQADQRPGQEADGEGAEGVLPQREDQGDPPGAGSQGRSRATRSRSSRRRSRRRRCRSRCRRRPRPSSSGSRRCRRSRPRRPSRATTSTGWSRSPGRRPRRS